MVELLPNSLSMNGTAGANMDEASGEMNVIAETRPSRNHLRLAEKLRGIAGSCCPSHPTMPFSRSDSGILSLCNPPFLLRVLRRDLIRDNLLTPLAFVFTRLNSDFSPGPILIEPLD